MAVNLGTGGIARGRRARRVLQPRRAAPYWSDLRRRNGSADPYDVKLWCLGNEMDGPWQTGHKDADEYGQLAAEAAKAMKLVDPTIELVACGSSQPRHADIRRTGSRPFCEHALRRRRLHLACTRITRSTATTGPASSRPAPRWTRFIDAVVATVDAVAARKRDRKRLKISFDEWNVWYQSRFAGPLNDRHRRAPARASRTSTAPSTPWSWVTCSSCLLNHSDRVRVACQAQLVNVIAPIMTEPGGPAWRQSIFYPMALTAERARGESLVARVSATGAVDRPLRRRTRGGRGRHP